MELRKNFVISLILFTFLTPCVVLAKPVNKLDAEKTVKGWLKEDPKPLNTSLGNRIETTEVFYGDDGQPAYYIVYLNPSGFVIVSADDLIEPVIGFVAGSASYDPSPANPLGALVSRDLPGRIDTARKLQKEFDAKVKAKDLTQLEVEQQSLAVKSKDKWHKLQAGADSLPAPTGVGTVSDMRVAPITQTKWGQDYVCGDYCYNYYTPNHWYCGCVATAMAQFMRAREWPADGTYDWNLMVYVPDCNITTAQRQEIGRLCSDAGVAAGSHYGSGGTWAFSIDAKNALISTFHYSNAIMGGTAGSNIGAGLAGMMNSTLDAGWPVILQIYPSGGHEVVGDGYGYQSSKLYHHINMGWDGYDDAWYNLPTVDSSPGFSSVEACIYNTYTSGDGEIISGRVTYSTGVPFYGATVTATGSSGPYTTTTNERGIYALVHVRAASTYTVSVSAPGCSFTPASSAVTTGTSTDYALTSGDKWDNNFTTSCSPPSPPPAPAVISYPTNSSTGQYTVSWSSSSGAVSYQLERSSNGGSSWTQIYSGANLSYSESIGNGSYRYHVKATNSGGSSGWTTGAYDCVVYIPPPQPPLPPASISYPSGSSGQHMVSWAASSVATSYQLARSNDGGNNWNQIYDGANTSYAENIGNGSYRYRVKAKNIAGESAWTTGTSDCVVFVPLPVTVEFSAGTSAGWDFQELAGDIVRNNTVDLNDLNVIAQHWLDSNCASANQWCSGADMDDNNDVTFIDYALLAKDWSKQAAENVLLQTIYGTAQDSAGNITANTNRVVSKDKGLAMAFSVPANTALDKGIFKCMGANANPAGTWRTGEKLRIRLFNVSGKNYLASGHPVITKTDPGSGNPAIVDIVITTPSPVPYHSEPDVPTRQYSDIVINFGPLGITAGEYFITFDVDASSPNNTWGSFTRSGNTTVSGNMGKYPDGSPLPKRATVTSGSTTGNTYYYQLDANTDTTYTAFSYLFAFQMLVKNNQQPVVDAGSDQTIILPAGANLDGTVTDDGLPVPPGAVTVSWTQQSGPGSVIFGNVNSVDTTVSFPEAGVYVLRLTASDSVLSNYDEVTITVQ